MHIDDIDPKSNSASISAKTVPDADEITSKSTRKKEALALQKLGLQLTQLKPDHLNSLVLPENLLKAIFDHKRFSSREAQRRQLQYIGRLMRELDTESIAQQLATLEGQSAQARHQFHQSEQWRSRLLKDPAALTDFVDTYPNVDVQKLRQLIKRTHQARTESQSKSSGLLLFRYIREIAS